MWANWEVAALAEWLCEQNKNLPPESKTGFYGLDVYSLWDSMNEMMKYLQVEDPTIAATVKKAIQCFEPYERDEQQYARYTLRGHSCRDSVVELLKEVRARAQFPDGDREAGFNAEQNALIAVNAEKYYRSMVGFDNESWNVRDSHMMETLDRLLHFHGKGAKGIVWAHNTHVGDARATDMKRAGMINIGQLAREQFGVNQVYLVGFGCFSGKVIAGEEWGSVMEEMDVPPAKESSIEFLLHEEQPSNRYFLFSDNAIKKNFPERIKHRAIGVVYQPYPERLGNYVTSDIAERYDAFIFLDKTTAVHPLHMQPARGRLPETYPFGM
jgi:erythromycin esterase-like protein